jgi:hypothetical protein
MVLLRGLCLTLLLVHTGAPAVAHPGLDPNIDAAVAFLYDDGDDVDERVGDELDAQQHTDNMLDEHAGEDRDAYDAQQEHTDELPPSVSGTAAALYPTAVATDDPTMMGGGLRANCRVDAGSNLYCLKDEVRAFFHRRSSQQTQTHTHTHTQTQQPDAAASGEHAASPPASSPSAWEHIPWMGAWASDVGALGDITVALLEGKVVRVPSALHPVAAAALHEELAHHRQWRLEVSLKALMTQ